MNKYADFKFIVIALALAGIIRWVILRHSGEPTSVASFAAWFIGLAVVILLYLPIKRHLRR